MMRRRGGPGLLSTMVRTAVISGTATATANRVNVRAAAKSAARQPQQSSEVPVAPAGELGQIQEQLTALQAQQAEVAALGETGAMIAHLQQLGQLRESGILTEAEFAAAKAKLLTG